MSGARRLPCFERAVRGESHGPAGRAPRLGVSLPRSMTSYGDNAARSRRGVWFASAGAFLAAIACAVGMMGRDRRPPTPPAPDVAPSGVATGPSQWMWRARRSDGPSQSSLGSEARSIELTLPSCAPDDAIYQLGDDQQCHPRAQPLLALVSQVAFSGAPRRHDGSDLAALLPPSRAAGEPEADRDAQRTGAARVRQSTFVDERDASWCGFVLEGEGARRQLRASCALDRLDLYAGAAPRVDRTQSCGVDRIEACTETCESNEDCGQNDDSNCGCEQSRCVRGRCTACAPRRVCGEPTFATRPSVWTFTVPVSAEEQGLAQALAARPSSFRTIFHFAVTNASRDVRPRRDGTIEFDSGYRLQVRPLAMSAAVCEGECRRSFKGALLLFAVPQWQRETSGLRLTCTRGRCSVAAVVGAMPGSG